jgi:hypothetical protein
MRASAEILKIFNEFKKFPKYHVFENEKEFISLCIENIDISFTYKSLKHIAGKNNANKMISLVLEIILSYEELRKNDLANRFILSKKIAICSGRPHAVVVEAQENGQLVIVTIFPTDTKYLERFEILWRTGVQKDVPSICISPKGDAGSRPGFLLLENLEMLKIYCKSNKPVS